MGSEPDLVPPELRPCCGQKDFRVHFRVTFALNSPL